jgi:hypothetical protein
MAQILIHNNKIYKKNCLITMVDENVTEFIYKIPMNIIFIVKDELKKQEISDQRYKHGFRENSYFIIKPNNELLYMNDLQYKKIVCNDTYINIIRGYNKYVLIQEAIKLNPFDSTHFGYIKADFKQHIPENINLIVMSLSEKLRIGLFNRLITYNPKSINFYNYNKDMLDTNFFTGSKDNMIKFLELFINELTLVLIGDLLPREDQIVAQVIFKNNEHFELFWSNTYDDILTRWMP